MKIGNISILFFLLSISLQGQNYWSDRVALKSEKEESIWIQPKDYRAVSLDLKSLNNDLKSSLSKSTDADQITIPFPDGTFQIFRISQSNVMAPELAAKFPEIRTYSGIAVDDPASKIYMDITPAGFHAMILSPKGTVFIDPNFRDNVKDYVVYNKKGYISSKPQTWTCGHKPRSNKLLDNGNQNHHEWKPFHPKNIKKSMAAVTLKTYRLAVAAQGEYTAFHGGTQASGLAAIVTAINRVTGIYETEVAVRLELVSNNNLVVFTNAATDPFSQNSDNSIDEVKDVLNNNIGEANYDVGHVFNTTNGGVANLGAICNNSNNRHKAEGLTGLPNPTGDPFWVDYVAHELGHQFGGNHTFNDCGNQRNSSTAYEPGSASTIQGYAGICSNSQNLQNNSDPHFHLVSLNEITTHITSGTGDNCDVASATGNNTPVANANAENINNKSIPISTPFELIGSATDTDGDQMTYSWEQWDLGPAGAASSTSTQGPIFRTFTPKSTSTRVFPQISDILNNTSTIGEVLPSVARTLNFQLVVRDNKAGGGGFDNDQITLNVVNSGGPFAITSQNNGGSLGGTITVTWNVSGTNNAPISCANVNILLSIDGGLTFPTTLANNVTNDGSHQVTLPNINTSTARLKVKCADNVFFDINNADFSITPSSNCSITSISAGTQSTCNPADNTYSQDITVNFTDPPGSGTLDVNGQSFAFSGTSQTVTLVNLPADGNAVNVTASFSDDSGCSRTENSLFTAPSSCITCSISNITAGNQSPCNTGDNTYTQELTVTYTNSIGSGTLTVNGQQFTITSSPQTVTLTNLAADGNAVNISASISSLPSCTYSANSVFTSPPACITNICKTYTRSNVNKSIPDNSSVTDILNISDLGSVTDVNVKDLNISHTWLEDIDINLISPDGTNIDIFSDNCDDRNNMNLSLDDEANTALNCGQRNGGNTFTPDNPLSGFDGKEINGNWTLSVADDEAGITGTLNSWGLEVCYDIPQCQITNLTAGTQTACNNSDNTYTQEITITYQNAPGSGTLDVNGQSFAITSSPQTITLTGLNSDGNNVNVTASFSAESGCNMTSNNLFTAPSVCHQCIISNVAAGYGTTCDSDNNKYGREIIVTFDDEPTSGNLIVNGQSFAIGTSPQSVMLSDLESDGNAVDVTVFFSDESSCTSTSVSLFIAPTLCLECNYSQNMISGNVSDTSFIAQQTLESDASVMSGLVRYRSNVQIELDTSFQVTSGAQFEATIGDCIDNN